MWNPTSWNVLKERNVDTMARAAKKMWNPTSWNVLKNYTKM
jgi:hypothetical protein